MTDEQARFLNQMILRIDGELLAIRAAIRGLIATHPDRAAAERECRHELERCIADGLWKDVHDPQLDAAEAFLDTLLRAGPKRPPT